MFSCMAKRGLGLRQCRIDIDIGRYWRMSLYLYIDHNYSSMVCNQVIIKQKPAVTHSALSLPPDPLSAIGLYLHSVAIEMDKLS
jgi:hypothetical protein